MHLFRYDASGTSPTKFEQATPIENYDSVMWVERYQTNGEFELRSLLGTGLRETLPIGTFISHQDTYEIMVVENHEVSESVDKTSELTITGRSLETILEQRIVGSNTSFPDINSVTGRVTTQYSIASAATYTQVVDLIENHIYAPNLVDASDAIADMRAYTALTGGAAPVSRIAETKTVYASILELLQLENLGIKCIRPGVWITTLPVGGLVTDAILEVHSGEDKTQQVLFSYDAGDVENAQYLWSIKKSKTSALVQGTWYEKMINGPETGDDRRVMVIDAKDVDQSYDVTTSAANRELILNNLETRGLQELSANNVVEIEQISLHRGAQRFDYRKDYSIGDLVTVQGNYGTSSTMRVTEHVEIEDETGAKSYPTLAIV